MGTTEDPKDGAAVATAVFGAVAVYGVSYKAHLALARWKRFLTLPAGFPNLLCKSSLATHARK